MHSLIPYLVVGVWTSLQFNKKSWFYFLLWVGPGLGEQVTLGPSGVLQPPGRVCRRTVTVTGRVRSSPAMHCPDAGPTGTGAIRTSSSPGLLDSDKMLPLAVKLSQADEIMLKTVSFFEIFFFF